MGFKSVKLKSIILCMFIVEILYLFWTVDILPFIMIATGCIGCLVYNYFRVYRDEDTVEMSDLLHTSTFQENIIYACIFAFSLFILFMIYLFGGEFLGEVILTLINGSKIIRFLMYGALFPNLFTYTVTWVYTDIKPVQMENINIFLKLLFISLSIGLLVCINWDIYSMIMISF